MVGYVFRKWKSHVVRKTANLEGSGQAGLQEKHPAVSNNVEENKQYLAELFTLSGDIKLRELTLPGSTTRRGFLIFVDGLAKGDLINEFVLEPLLHRSGAISYQTMRDVTENLLAVGDVKLTEQMADVLSAVLFGDTALFLDGLGEAALLSTKGFEKRGVEEANNETVVRGPKESFNENLRTNTTLLRRKIKDASLVIEGGVIGRRTKTPIALAYIRGLADPKLLERIRGRLASIDTDSILESGYVEQYIEDAPFSLFQTIGHTEKPDVLAAKLLEGRVGIFVDGTPVVLTAPLLLVELFQSAEDYYIRPWFASFLRMLRYVSFFLSIFTPALYVALTTFHQELLPTSFLFTLASVREGLPFTSFVETLVMLLIFEVLREAGLRLPKPIGQTISIVGALVMGEAAVSAGIVGPPLVICIALTAVAGFVVPALSDQQTVLRFAFLFLAGFMGGFGITIGFIGLLIHFSSLQSFGFAYAAPFLPFSARDWKDTWIRAPLWLMRTRPVRMAEQDEVRENCPVPPAEPEREAVVPDQDDSRKEQEQ